MSDFGRIGVIGLGQMGTSLAMGLAGHARLRGFDSDPQAARAAASQLGLELAASAQELLAEEDLCFLAVPASAAKRLLSHLDGSRIGHAGVIADVCSTKADIDLAAQEALAAGAAFRYVGLHPLAGNERRGIAGGEATLFAGRTMVVAAGPASDPRSALEVAAFLSDTLGCKILFADPRAHDLVTNYTISLPHIFAFLAAAAAHAVPDARLLEILAGNSYGDVTRVAKSEPQMVASFLWANRENLAASLRAASEGLGELAREIAQGDEAGLAGLLGRMAPLAVPDDWQEASLSLPVAADSDYRAICEKLAASRLVISRLVVSETSVEAAGMARSGPPAGGRAEMAN